MTLNIDRVFLFILTSETRNFHLSAAVDTPFIVQEIEMGKSPRISQNSVKAFPTRTETFFGTINGDGGT